MLPVTVANYYINRSNIIEDTFAIAAEGGVVNNMAYYLVGLMPLAFLLKNKFLSFSVSSLILVLVIQSAKRGALISATVAVLFLLYFHLKNMDRRTLRRSAIRIFAAMIGFIYYAFDYFRRNEHLIARFNDIQYGNVSGRDIIYANIFTGWFHAENFLNLLFGFGFAASLEMSGTGNYAHNDWLELLSNFGLLGVIVYVLFFYSAFRLMRLNEWELDKKIIFLMVLSIWFINGLTAASYTSISSVYLTIMIATIIGSEGTSVDIQRR